MSKSPSINEAFSLFPMTQDQRLTCESILSNEGSRLLIAPSHHINQFQVDPLIWYFFFYIFFLQGVPRHKNPKIFT